MALIGNLSETPFHDLVQLYGGSASTAVLVVKPAHGPEGRFWFQSGSLVHAELGELAGREAVARALRLREGAFRVEPNVAPPTRSVFERWDRILLQEMVGLDQERGARGLGGGEVPGVGGGPRVPGRVLRVAAAIGIVLAALAGMALLLRKPPSPRPSATLATAPPVEAASPTRRAVRGVTASEILIGMSSPLSGVAKELGRGMRAGVEVAFAAANEAGGLHGRRLRLLALDDGNEPARATEAMRELLDRREVFAVVGNAGSATASAALPVALQHGALFLGALGESPDLRRTPPRRTVFTYRPGYAAETAAAVRWLVEVERVPPAAIAVLAEEGEFGEAGYRGAVAALHELDPALPPPLRVALRHNAADVDPAVSALRPALPRLRAVVMVANGEAASRAIERLKAIDPKLLFTDVSGLGSDVLADQLAAARVGLSGDVVVTQVVPLPTSRSAAVIRYRELLAKHALGAEPGFASLEGFVVGSLLVEGLRRAGPDLDTERLASALEGLHSLDLGFGAALELSPENHTASRKVWAAAPGPQGAWRAVDLQ